MNKRYQISREVASQRARQFATGLFSVIATFGAGQAISQSQAVGNTPDKPVRITIRPDGSLVPQAGARLPDGMPDVATPLVRPDAPANESPRQEPPRQDAPSASRGSIAAPNNTPAARAVEQARDAMRAKQWQQLSNLVPQAQGDVLEMYPAYWALRQQLWSARGPATSQAVRAFMERYPGSFLADRLRADWVLIAAGSGDFLTVRDLGAVRSSNSQVRCAQLEARHMNGERAKAAEALSVFAPASACWKLFDQMVADRVLGSAELVPLWLDAVENNKVNDARRLAAYVLDKADLDAYDAMMRDPAKWLSTQSGNGASMRNLIIAIGLSRVAKKDLGQAETLLKDTWGSRLPRADVQWVRSQMALQAVLSLDDRAYGWYRDTAGARLSTVNHAWRVRSALRQPKIDWAWIIQCIDQMPQELRQDPAWVYWKARGLAATGQAARAQELYTSISKQFNFYGQLAAEELGQTISAPARPAAVTTQELAQARENPALRRAVTLFKRGWRQEGVQEWNFALLGMNDRQLLAAAELARQEHIYDRVVNTSERTRNEVDFSQRFIAPFEGRVTAQAREIELDPAWVYGLIRQESRFIMDARSVVGASGLMQLMPATARWVANKIGMTDFHPSKVNDFDTNTKLGTSYLSMVLQDLGGSQVLASAGYNAGPGRPMQWRSKLSHPVEGAIFAETIPFNETRDYVKNVMSNATYYAALFSGKPQSLKERLGEIAPQGNIRTKLP